MLRFAFTLAILLVCSLFAACGDDDDDASDEDSPSASATEAADTPTDEVTPSPEPSPTDEPTAPPPTAEPTSAPSNTVEEAVITYVTTIGLDIPREMSEPLYCADLADDPVGENVGKVCILGPPLAGVIAIPGTAITVDAGVTFSDGVWTLTVEVVDGAWTVTNSVPATDGL
jgi:hypothetical protein